MTVQINFSNGAVEHYCEVMHDAYEIAATKAGWETQKASRKPWADVPEANKATMRAAVRALLQVLEEKESTAYNAMCAKALKLERENDLLKHRNPGISPDRMQDGKRYRVIFEGVAYRGHVKQTKPDLVLGPGSPALDELNLPHATRIEEIR